VRPLNLPSPPHWGRGEVEGAINGYGKRIDTFVLITTAKVEEGKLFTRKD
jgi:hypothetical protein